MNSTMDYKKGKLLGRLANGFQLDHGKLVHAVVFKKTKRPPCPYNNWGKNETIDDYYQAELGLCGAKPGKRSVGWSFNNGTEQESEVTCSRCLKKLGKDLSEEDIL